MRLVLLGAPGSGKGTQGVLLAKRLGVPLVSTGELLRAQAAAGTDLGRQVAGYLNRGDLVPDDLLLAALDSALRATMTAGGYVLDGFPRTLAQAHHAEEVAAPEAVIHLAVPDDVARRRLAGRAGADRTDDTEPEVVERRLRRYHSETEPLLDFYRQRGILHTVDASQSPEAVSAAIMEALR
ncbi:MAG TPA: nucleoside monophosphate kinase [Acidimicrobiia bacterium]|jgi:adenylate kinase